MLASSVKFLGSVVTCVAVSPDTEKTRLAAGLDDGAIVLCDVVGGFMFVVTHNLEGHTSMINTVAFSCAADKQLLASGSNDKTVRLWCTETLECVTVLEGHTDSVYDVAFSPDGRLLASASRDETVRLWDMASQSMPEAGLVLQEDLGSVYSVTFSPDGRLLASGSTDTTVRLWFVDENYDVTPGPVLKGHLSAVRRVAFSCNNMLASASYHKIKLWDRSAWKLVRELYVPGDTMYVVDFSPDGRQLVSGSAYTVRLWDVATGALLKTFTGHANIVQGLAFHPNGKQVVSGSVDQTVRLWPVCKWSDRTHYLFCPELQRIVFVLMCVRERLQEKEENKINRLPMILWLDIFQFVAFTLEK